MEEDYTDERLNRWMVHRKRTLQQGDYWAGRITWKGDYIAGGLHGRRITKGGKLLENLNDREIIWEEIIRKELNEGNYCCYCND